MSFASSLALVFGKRPLWLYRFTRGNAEQFFTSRSSDYLETDIDVFDTPDVFYSGGNQTDVFGRTWEGIALSQTRIRTTSAIGRAECKIRFPRTNAWAATYVTDNGYQPNTVTIQQVFLDDADKQKSVRFRGRVVTAAPGITRTDLVCENRFTETRSKGLSVVMQRPCRHALYHQLNGLGCGASLADFQVDGTLTSITGKVHTVVQASGQANGYYAGGVFEWQGTKQLILGHSGTSLTLLGSIPGLATAQALSNQSVKIAPGCDLTRQTCNDRFNALANFGGFPWADETPYDGRQLF